MKRSRTHWSARQKAELIFEAIKNKYGNADNDMLWRLVLHLVDGTPVVYEPERPIDFAPVENVRIDIVSQIRTLTAIESDEAPDRNDLIRWIQSQLLGRELTEGDFRATAFVEDFRGEPPVAVKDIQAALREIELMCNWVIAANIEGTTSARAALLAHLYSSVIRIHPFADANGRTARFLVQYTLRKWGEPLMPIPKVRNDQDWHTALSKAIEGDLNPLSEQFRSRLGP